MDPYELKQTIRNLSLEPELEQLLLDLIDGAGEVSPELLNMLADILEFRADFEKSIIKLLEQEAKAYQELLTGLEKANEDEIKSRMASLRQEHQRLLEDLKNKAAGVHAEAAPPAPPEALKQPEETPEPEPDVTAASPTFTPPSPDHQAPVDPAPPEDREPEDLTPPITHPGEPAEEAQIQEPPATAEAESPQDAGASAEDIDFDPSAAISAYIEPEENSDEEESDEPEVEASNPPKPALEPAPVIPPNPDSPNPQAIIDAIKATSTPAPTAPESGTHSEPMTGAAGAPTPEPQVNTPPAEPFVPDIKVDEHEIVLPGNQNTR